jgi:hypothetical protein
MRTTSGSWRVHRDLPNLPAWIEGSRRVDGALGGRVVAFPRARIQAKSAYGGVAGGGRATHAVTCWFDEHSIRVLLARPQWEPDVNGG